MVVVPVLVRDVGLKLAAAPAGNEVVPNVTEELNPPDIVSVTVYVALPPAATLTLVGETLNEKFLTVSVMFLV
jgi:hypothetical protein